jgi:sugar phosphate isomerase/epimerase
LREIGTRADELGLRIALEPFQREGIENWSIVNTIGDAVELIDEAGAPALGIQFDIWHLWNTDDVFAEVHAHVDRIYGVHVNDWRDPTRGWADRVLPGDGIADVPALLAALERAGWDGYYDLEIFSDNGAFGADYDGSLWNVPAGELARRARDSFTRCWERRTVTA